MTDNNAALAEKLEEPAQKAAVTTTLQETIYAYEEHFAMALAGTDVSPQRFVRMAFTAVNSNEMLKQADRFSLMGSLLGCAALGLEPSSPLGQAYIVPFKDQGKVKAQLIVGYQGYIDLAYRSGRVMSIYAHVVREQDEFSYEFGSNAHLTHRPSRDAARGEVTDAYGFAVLAGGGHVFDVLSKEQIEARKARSKAKGDRSPWQTDYEAMARKSAIRQLFKWLPTSTETQKALGADGAVWREIPDGDKALDPGIIDVEGEEV